MKNSIIKSLIKQKKSIFMIFLFSIVIFNSVPIIQSQEPIDEEIITIFGRVVYVDLEGGFYGIISNLDEQYDPINLPVEFQQNGLPVYVVAKIRDDLGSIHMWGIIIEILEINDISLVEDSQEIGDVNNDGNIDILDALLLAQNYVGLPSGSFDPRFADVDLNGNIDVIDALMIAQKYVGLITELPSHSIPLIEGSWSLRHIDWQGNLVDVEFVTIERIGNEVTIFSDTYNELLGTGKIIKNNLDPPYNDRSEYLIQGIDFRGLGIDKIFIDDNSHMETELPLAESFNPSIFSRIITVIGEYQLIQNPPTTDPPLPGMVYGLISDREYILTNERYWVWSEEEPRWLGYTPNLGEIVEITGYTSIGTDITGSPFYELEVININPVSSILTLTIMDNDTLQEIDVGTYVRITLEQNPSTGYQWQYTIEQDTMELVSDEYIPPEEPIPGAPGIRVIALKMNLVKDFSFIMNYVRDWEEDPIRQYIIDFSVKNP